MSPHLPTAISYRGADMGRCSAKPQPAPGRKWSVVRVPLDAGGYDSGGAYWGIGQRLYMAQTKDKGEPLETFYRADDRAHAKEKVTAHFPGARFFR